MALLTDEQKNNFDTTLPANYDALDGTLNPQPLNVDDEGLLKVAINGGSVVSNMTATNEYTGLRAVTCNKTGALDAGGTRIQTLQNGNCIVVTSVFDTFDDLTNNLSNVINSFRDTFTGAGWSRIYLYKQSIVYDGSKFNVVLSGFGGDVTE